MNRLEQEIFLAITEHPFHTNLDRARIAAKIALELAEKAFKAGGNGEYYDEGLGGMSDEYSEESLREFKQKIL